MYKCSVKNVHTYFSVRSPAPPPPTPKGYEMSPIPHGMSRMSSLEYGLPR